MQSLPRHVLRVFRRISVNAQVRLDELEPGQGPRKGIKLRAISDLPEKDLRMVRVETQHADVSSGRFDQPGHQVHQRGLARAVWTDQAGDPRLNNQAHAVHTENLAVEF